MENEFKEKLDNYRECVKKLVSEKRYNHIISVEKQAIMLAKIYKSDQFSVAAAAILHDAAKEMQPQKQLELIKSARIIFAESEQKNLKLWHAAASAAYAKLNLKIEDINILNAILYHTSGRADMNLIEKIVFVADLTSDDRKYKDVKKLQALAKVSLEKVIAYYSNFIINQLKKNGEYISDSTKETFKYYSCFLKN